MSYSKELFNRNYTIDDSECSCGSEMVQYETRETVGHKAWDSNRQCEILMDKRILSARCPCCTAIFKIHEE